MVELYPMEAIMLSIIWLLIGYALAEAVICFMQNDEDK